jgi:hypothetical protein
VLQFFTLGALLPLLALTIWNNLQDSTQVVHIFQTNALLSFKVNGQLIAWIYGLSRIHGLLDDTQSATTTLSAHGHGA